jgi:hypothetical protein
MANTLQTVWGVLRLDTATYQRIGDDQQGFRTSLKLVTAVGLMVGLGQLVGFRGMLAQPTLAEKTAQLAENVTNMVNALPRFLASSLSGVVEILNGMATAVANVEAPLGAQTSQLLRLLGQWLSIPLNLLATWLLVAMVVWLFARFLGGRGELDRHIRLVLLAAVPELLLVVGWLPGAFFNMVAPWVTAIALVWSIVILVQTVSVAHTFSRGRAVGTLLATVIVSAIVLFLLSYISLFALVKLLFL